jgi:hypothetical protein
MGEDHSARQELLKDSKIATATCLFTSDKVQQLKRIQKLKTKINKECIDLQLNIRRDQTQRDVQELKDSQRKWNDETQARD